MQGTLFHELTEIEAQAVRLAVEEYNEDVRVIGIHAREQRARQHAQDEDELRRAA
jgi:hypothetical protein